MGNAAGKEAVGDRQEQQEQQQQQQRQAPSRRKSGTSASAKHRDRPAAPGLPLIVPRRGGNVLDELAYSKLPDDAVVLRWLAPIHDGGTPVYGYAVEKRAMGPARAGEWTRAHPVDVRETEAAVTGVHLGQSYQFRVRAVNAMGPSEPSKETDAFRVPYEPAAMVRPSFSAGLRDAVVMEHEMVEFNVEVHGVPPPVVEWTVNGLPAAEHGGNVAITPRDPDTGRALIALSDVSASDGGEIKCTATNDVGESTSVAVLSVEAPPRALVAKKYEDGLIFEDGDQIRLRVDFTGRPQPDVTWYHENEPITAGDRVQVDTSSESTVLKVAAATRSDRGEYSVKLQSGLGEDGVSFLVTVANRPSPPGRPHASNATETAVTLEWTCPEDDGGCAVTSYIVEYNRMGWDMWLKATTSRQNRIRLDDLIPASVYVFRLKAENPYGVSEPSEPTDPVVLPSAKSDEPTRHGVEGEPEPASEPAEPDDTTASSSNLGPRDPCSYDPASRSGADAENDDGLDDEEMPAVRPGNPWASFF